MATATSRPEIERAYRESATQLWRGVYAYTGGRADIADDAVAEAFARAIESAAQIRSLVPWLYRVAFRHAASRLREAKRAAAVDDVPEAFGAAQGATASLGVLELLTPQQRAVVFLFYYADFSVADIARATSSSRVAVRVQLHRAREALRRHYGSADGMRAWTPTGGTDEHELV
ncbi:MAG TPA: RNA polymerase sigma factor [Gaiellaceae bacterium]|jgi:RNA polymerase sigma-70 factor (ECF subfamily)